MWIISKVFHLQTPPRAAMHSGVGWSCCSYVPEAVLAAGGAKITRYFLCFPILSPLRKGHEVEKEQEDKAKKEQRTAGRERGRKRRSRQEAREEQGAAV
jgi:hypothetical protein